MVSRRVGFREGEVFIIGPGQGQSFTIDFYKKYKPAASEAKLLQVGRIATIVVVVLGIVWIPVMQMVSGVLYEYLQLVQALIAPGIAAVFSWQRHRHRRRSRETFCGFTCRL